MARTSHFSDEEQRLDRLEAATKCKCSYCGEELIFAQRNDHKCLPPETLGDILADALANQEKETMIQFSEEGYEQHIAGVINNHSESTQNAFIAKLYECVASHYENGDRTGAEAILNAIGYAQQES